MQDYLEAMSQYRGAAQLEQNIETAKQIGMEYLLKWVISGGVTAWAQAGSFACELSAAGDGFVNPALHAKKMPLVPEQGSCN